MTKEGLMVEYKREYLKESSADHYEETRSLNQDLSFTSFEKELLEAGLYYEKIHFKTLHLIGLDGLYTNLALLLSDQCKHTIKLAVFQDTTKLIFRDRIECTGSLFQQLHEAYAFIERYNKLGAEFEGLKRIDKRDYPSEAIREALFNALIHRDYSFSASTLISIFDNRIEFLNIGGLVKGISKEDMFLGLSLLRNQHLAHIFYRLKFIEAFGTGIPKIMESYQGCAYAPLIETTDNAFKITIYNTQYNLN